MTIYTLNFEEADRFLYENAVMRRIDDTLYSYTWQGENLHCSVTDEDGEYLF